MHVRLVIKCFTTYLAIDSCLSMMEKLIQAKIPLKRTDIPQATGDSNREIPEALRGRIKSADR